MEEAEEILVLYMKNGWDEKEIKEKGLDNKQITKLIEYLYIQQRYIVSCLSDLADKAYGNKPVYPPPKKYFSQARKSSNQI